MRILVTGTDGFIGSCLIEELKSRYSNTILLDKYDINTHKYDLSTINFKKYNIIVHLGAISETNCLNHNILLKNNICDTLNIFDRTSNDCRILYASSASVYGNHETPVTEDTSEENGVSPYAQSKLVIDNIVRNFLYDRPIIGLRFFNVCSFDKEDHKKQPSPTFSFRKQLIKTKKIQLFKGSDKIFRDFIFINDIISIINFFIFKDTISCADIYNIGSGQPVSFEDIANSFIKTMGYGEKIYINPPNNLTNSYQTFTQADITKLRSCGYTQYIPSVLEYINGQSTN